MAGLRFAFAELVRETKALKTIARDFLDPNTTWALDQLVSNIESLWSSTAGTTLTLAPLWTLPSHGAYEPGDRRGGPSIRAVITGTWDVAPLGINAKKPIARQKRLLEFCGAASTKIELFEATNGGRIAMWRMELGADDAPGCYVHVQVLGDTDAPPFPHSVPVPRLPGIFVTPMSAIEYVLGELFQDQWTKAAMGDSGDLPYWRELQRERLRRLLAWHQGELQNLISSPWMTLKAAKPAPALFLS